MLSPDDVIAKQLSILERTEMVFDVGRKTTLTPARYVPMLADGQMNLSLNGTWYVLRWPFEDAEEKLASPEWPAPGIYDTRWGHLDQPGKVFYYDPEQNPATIKDWNRVTLAHIAPEDGAIIRRDVTIPAEWAGKHIYLRFDSIYPAGRVYVNGQLLGEHLSGLTPVEWNVTTLVRPGRRAVIAVRLLRKHKHVQMDMPRHALEFTGLAQDACLHAVEPCRISDYHLISTVDGSLRDGAVEGNVWLTNQGVGPATCNLAVSVLPREERAINGRPLATASAKIRLKRREEKTVPVLLRVPDVELWNDEFPNLYEVSLRLRVRGQATQEVAYRTGFRRLDLTGGRPTLNGHPVKFRGVNHLTFHPQFGMYTPPDWLRQCLTLMKHANVNAIRTHFLGPRVLADLCDELGIYLLQELPIDWGHDYVHDPDCVGPVLTRLEGGIRRDRHHPSVMVWSIGNENLPRNMKEHADFFNHLRLFDRFAKTLDPSRPTMFPPPGPANKIKAIFETRVGDIADTHYSFALAREVNETGQMSNPMTWEAQMETTTREEAIARGWSGVWFSSEYGIMDLRPDLLNAPYSSIIADVMEDALSGKNTQQVFADRLRREWCYMRDDPTCLGGAYFPWLCAGAGEPWGWVRWGEDADWGVVTADLLPKPAFWAMRVLFSPVAFPERLAWKPGETDLVFEARNGHNAVDLKDCTLRTQMGGGPPWMGMLRDWQDVPIAGAPGQLATIRIPIWNPGTLKTLESGAPIVCRCTLLDPHGYRPITADILVIPEKPGEKREAMPIGPDAV